MSSQPNLTLTTDYLSWGMGILLLFLIALALLIFLVVKYQPRLLLAFVGICLVIFLPVAFLFMSYAVHEVRTGPTVIQQATADSSTATVQNAVIESSHIPLPTLPLEAQKPQATNASEQSNHSGDQIAQTEPLPEWINAEQQGSVNSKRVFESGLFATREEALQDALGKASLKLAESLQAEHPQYPLATKQIGPEAVRHVALRRSYYQTVEHDFGDVLKSGKPFKQDMYRAYVEVEISPSVKKIFYTKWKLQAGNQRVAWLGGAFGLVTLLCFGVSVYLRAAQP
ncbi:hypothetical protein Pan153_61450 [Gimesia panareensis]|uniref:Uncharacterized protein n=1 Tax=Gimesia panareensis TaxID=2527978 RepID=A0A518FYL0_9PLAN|nr:hypothetical protein [Gimesia panareensis]QDV21457.1 hypothetical protein Pan153_61450 [Gimesia panareensis]